MALYRIPFRWNLLMNVCGEDVTKEEMDKQENRTEDEDHFMQPWPEYEVSANTKTQKRFSNPARSSTASSSSNRTQQSQFVSRRVRFEEELAVHLSVSQSVVHVNVVRNIARA